MNDFQKQGWVRFYRKSMDSTVWKNPIVWMVWSWCLLKANHEDNTFPFNGKDITIKKGSFITGQEKALKELTSTFTAQKYRTAISYLKSTGRITIKSNNKFSIITIEKWENYQLDNRLTNKPVTNQQQTNNKPVTTNKNVKNEKNNPEQSSDTKKTMKKNTMGKYNESDSSDSYEEVIDSDSGEIVVDKKSNTNKIYWDLIKWAEERRGFKFLNVKKQFKAFKIAKDAGIEPKRIVDRWYEFEKDKFWSNTGFDFLDVVNNFNKRK